MVTFCVAWRRECLTQEWDATVEARSLLAFVLLMFLSAKFRPGWLHRALCVNRRAAKASAKVSLMSRKSQSLLLKHENKTEG
jgi:hypothetical protein